MNSRTRSFTACQVDRITRGPRKVVSIASTRLMPSMPRW